MGNSEVIVDVQAVCTELLMLDRLRVQKLERSEISATATTTAEMATAKASEVGGANAHAAIAHDSATTGSAVTVACLASDPHNSDAALPSATDELPTGAADLCTAPATAAPSMAALPVEVPPAAHPISSVRVAHGRTERVGYIMDRSERAQIRPSNLPSDTAVLTAASPMVDQGSMAICESAASAPATAASCAWGSAFFLSSAAHGPPQHTQ